MNFGGKGGAIAYPAEHFALVIVIVI